VIAGGFSAAVASTKHQVFIWGQSLFGTFEYP
jgi:hypothetical protein